MRERASHSDAGRKRRHRRLCQLPPARVYRDLPQFYVGEIVDYKISALSRITARSGRRSSEALATHPSYVKLATWLSMILGVALYLTVVDVSAHVRRGLHGALLAAARVPGTRHRPQRRFSRSPQGSLLGHRVRTLGGISLGWWKKSHNVHHIICNSIEHDPDIRHLPSQSTRASSASFFPRTTASGLSTMQLPTFCVVPALPLLRRHGRRQVQLVRPRHLAFDPCPANEHRKLEAATVGAFRLVWRDACVRASHVAGRRVLADLPRSRRRAPRPDHLALCGRRVPRQGVQRRRRRVVQDATQDDDEC